MDTDKQILDDDFNLPDENNLDYKLAKFEIEDAEERVKNAAKILYFLGGFSFLGALIVWNLQIVAAGLSAIIGFILGCVYIGLGVLSLKKPLIAMSSALIFYLLIQTIMIAANPSRLSSFIIIKIAIVLFLSLGLYNAIQVNKIRKKWNIKN